MNLSGVPYKFQYTWGQNATAGFVTSPIPATTVAPAASQSLGFPPATAAPIASGGTPPNIDDFNGAYQYVTSWLQWLQSGGPIQYDATLQTNIGGYPNGAVVQSATHPGSFWMSTTDGNATNPDTGGAGWIKFPVSGRLIATSSTTWTVPTGCTHARFELWAPGGGGGGAQSTGGAGGAGAGGYCEKSIAVTAGDVYTITIGSPGSPGSSTGTNGTNGGTATVTGTGLSLTANGGVGGGAAFATGGSGGGGPGGTSSGGDLNTPGGTGENGFTNGTLYVGGSGGAAPFGGSITSITVGTPFPGAFPGGGGGGAANGQNGGVGANGFCRVTFS